MMPTPVTVPATMPDKLVGKWVYYAAEDERGRQSAPMWHLVTGWHIRTIRRPWGTWQHLVLHSCTGSSVGWNNDPVHHNVLNCFTRESDVPVDRKATIKNPTPEPAPRPKPLQPALF